MPQDLNYTLLTFYKFVDIPDAQVVVSEHREFCVDIGLRGRIFIGEEGISATLTGKPGQIKAYRLYLDSIPFFRDIPDIDEKACKVDGHKFHKMIVRYRKEIVALGRTYSAEQIRQATHKISVDDFKRLLEREDDSYVILDMRNDYEYKLGHFKNAVPAGTIQFREVPQLVEKYKSQFGDKPVVMYCTGGIRCEKLSAMLEEQGMPGVFQLDGGIVKYVNKYRTQHWLGNLYTFDERVSCPVADDDNKIVITECHYTGKPADIYFNCRYGPCNAQIIALPEQYKKHFGFCSEECYNKALNDLLVRNDFSFDHMNYKILRGQIKANPEKRDLIKVQIINHLKANLDGIKFNHEKSAKVNYIQ